MPCDITLAISLQCLSNILFSVMMFPVSRILEMRLFTDPKEGDYYKSVSFLLEAVLSGNCVSGNCDVFMDKIPTNIWQHRLTIVRLGRDPPQGSGVSACMAS